MARCPSIDELERSLDQNEGSDELRAHLVDCTRCRTRARRIEENNGFLRGLGDRGAGGFNVAARAAAMSDDVPHIPGIEGFELLRELHRGGQGVIYLARQTATKRMVAIKMLLSAAMATSRQRRRFEREIEIVAGLRHSQIVTVFESGVTAAGLLWFAMEYVDGVPLDVYLNQKRPPLKDILRLMASVCEAVAYAHQRGIIHRDLKPANIIVDQEGRPHVLDFGLAKVAGSTSPEATAARVTATQAGEFMGTYAYAAPEQFRGASNQIDTRTDVYALGTILYEALTNRHPFPASGSLPEFIRDADHRTITPPSEFIRHFPAELEAVVLCALSLEPVRRYQSAGALAQDILRFVTGEPVEARRDSRWYLLRKAAHRHRLAMAVVGAFIIVAISFAVLATVQARRVSRERDKALTAEHATAQTAQTLAQALSASNIERGRLLVRSGNIPLGERMIWREWLNSPVEPWGVNPWPPDSDAYWAMWEMYSRSPCRQTLRIGVNAIPKVSVSRDGKLLGSCSSEGILKVWKLPEMALLRDFGPVKCGIYSLTFSPDGELVASGDAQGHITFWSISSGNVVREFQVLPEGVRGVQFTSDGKTIVVHGDDRRATAWTVEGKQIELPALGLIGVRTIDVDPVNRRVAISESSNEKVVLVDLDDKVPPIILPKVAGMLRGVTAERFSPNGKLIALGRENGFVDMWDVASERCLWSIRLHRAAALAFDFSPDGLHLASGGRDRTIHILSVTDGTILRTLTGHTGSITTLGFFDDGLQLATAGLDELIKIWDVSDGPGVRAVTHHDHTVFHVGLSADGLRLASCAAGGVTAQVCDLRTGDHVVKFMGHQGMVLGTAFSQDGEMLATGGSDNEIRLWNAADGKCKAVLKGHENAVESVAFCHGGKYLASASDDSTARIWDVASGDCIAVLRGHTGRCPKLAVSPDGKLIVSCSIDGTIRLWSSSDGNLLGSCSANKMPIRTVCFTPDGKDVLTGGDDTMIRVWDVATRQCIATLDGNDQDIFCVAVSPDGRFVASTTRGGAVQLWSLARRRHLATLAQDNGSVFSACFTPNSRSLVICGEDGCVRLLDLTYFDTHMQGNRDVQMAVLKSEAADNR